MERIFNFFIKSFLGRIVGIVILMACILLAVPYPPNFVVSQTVRIIAGSIGVVIVLFLSIGGIIVESIKKLKTPPEIKSENQKPKYNIVNIFSEETVEKILQEEQDKNN